MLGRDVGRGGQHLAQNLLHLGRRLRLEPKPQSSDDQTSLSARSLTFVLIAENILRRLARHDG